MFVVLVLLLLLALLAFVLAAAGVTNSRVQLVPLGLALALLAYLLRTWPP